MQRSPSFLPIPKRRQLSVEPSGASSFAASPYSLLYTLRPGEIRILAVMHQSRRPFYWWGRT